MKRLAILPLVVFSAYVTPTWAQRNSCANFQRLVGATYNFKPSKLSKAEQDSKGREMDKVWEAAKANPAELTPCLRAGLEEANADPWFRLDGVNLLVDLDPSSASKELQVRVYTGVDFDDMDPRVWVQTLRSRGRGF